MTGIGRREFLAGAGAMAWTARPALAAIEQAAATRAGAVFPASVRDDFPAASLETYMNAAAVHPLGRLPPRRSRRASPSGCRAPAPGAPTSTTTVRPT